jgi:ABC-2 type transport system ATP-binding protein
VIASDDVISIDRLTKTYRSGLFGGRSITALRQVSLQARRGEIFGLLGPNGAGKTTLIKILLGVIRSSGGSARVLGFPAGSIAARKRVGYLPESLRIDRHHTARSALRFYGGMSGLSRDVIATRSNELLRLVGLEGRDRESVKRFSKGMYQRLGLAQALLHEPDLLILDEPTDGLDPVGRSEVRRLLLELRSLGKTIFLNSHILQEVELVCDRVAVMAAGQVRGIGTIDELTERLGDRQVKWDLAGVDDEQSLGRLLSEAAELPVRDGEAFVRSAATGGNKIGGRQVLLDRMPSGVVRATVPWVNQAVIDRTIDQLRATGMSIVSLTTPRRSLEDVFLSLVGSTEAEVDSDIAAGVNWKPGDDAQAMIESAVVGTREDENAVNGVAR